MSDLFRNFDPRYFVVSLLVIVLSITLHEFGHAISADRLGDETPRRQGRITLWPDKHFDIFGFLFMIVTLLSGHGMGWGKPVQVDFHRLRHPRRDMFIVAAFGPLMNLILATIAGLILRVSIATGHVAWLANEGATSGPSLAGLFAIQCLYINLSLMFFNLIPVHPLDGSKILSSFLPTHQAVAFERTVGVYGPIVLMVVCWMAPGVLWHVLGPPVSAVAQFLMGTPNF